MGIAWLWIVPLVLGWYIVGTQSSPDPIRRAGWLLNYEGPTRNQVDPGTTRDASASIASTYMEEGTVDSRGSLISNDRDEGNRERPSKFISPDDELPGPTYNYARSFAWCMTFKRVFQNLDRTHRSSPY